MINEDKMNEDLRHQLSNFESLKKYFRPDCTYNNILDETQKRIEEQLEKKDGKNMIEFLKTASRGIIDDYRFYFERFLQIFFKITSLSISHF